VKLRNRLGRGRVGGREELAMLEFFEKIRGLTYSGVKERGLLGGGVRHGGGLSSA